MKKIFLVVTGSQVRKNIEAGFLDIELAKQLAREFPTGKVEELKISETFPELYKYEVWMEKDTGDVVESNTTIPSLEPIVVENGDGLIYVLGNSNEDAEQRAEQFRQDLLDI